MAKTREQELEAALARALGLVDYTWRALVPTTDEKAKRLLDRETAIAARLGVKPVSATDFARGGTLSEEEQEVLRG